MGLLSTVHIPHPHRSRSHSAPGFLLRSVPFHSGIHCAELRRKGVSYATIAELLTQHSLPTCRSAIARFCHEELSEEPRTRSRLSACHGRDSLHRSRAAVGRRRVQLQLSNSESPRIANIELADPTDS